MKVYCPCGKECLAYHGGALEECNCVQVSHAMPDRFKSHIVGQVAGAFTGDSSLSKLGRAIAGVGTAYLLNKDDSNDATSYEVWQCPACPCEALYMLSRQEGSVQWQKIAQITSCG